ncbi:MAG: helix-turn-helix transcriptional regulator [Rhodospirillaceae bacterium]|jgi:ArsR family transcriptional regulator, virulence genes transcriptional regulator|nr:helix-turn-helix transcriptional regulator [Rhodospirillaceae bacterium]
METHFNPENMDANADRVARFLKSIANRVRLRILCCLMQGEKAAGGLSRELGISQANLSQHLTWLKHEGLVQNRREGTVIFYSLSDTSIEPLMELLHDMFCTSADAPG